jgi:replication-associated recombination protein RarA
MNIVGHERNRVLLTHCDSPAVLLLGPTSVGKFTTARSVTYSWGVRPTDLFCIEGLTSADARSVCDLSLIPPFGDLRAFIIRLDSATAQAQNILLKTLEEPPDRARFLLVASEPPLPTIVSRCQVFEFGLLSDTEVRAILLQTGMSAEAADRQAPLGGGRVRPAQEGVSAQARGQVLSVLRALSSRDAGQMGRALQQWDGAAHELLSQWAAEASSGRWRIFTPDTAPGITIAAARQLLGLLGRYQQASPRLAAAAVLTPMCAR